MAAYLTWRGIPPPRSLESLIQRTLQPHVPPPKPGTYGNAAIARMMARSTRLDSSSYSPQRTTATITTPLPQSRAATATRATNVRARTLAETSSTSPDPSTSAPPIPAAEPHQQHAADATRTTGGLAPSRAGTPQSPRQERASKRAAQRQPTQHHAATGSRGHLASPARSRALPGPTNTGAVGTQPGQPPGTAHPHRVPAPSPTGSRQPLTPPVAPSHGPRLAASQAATTQAHPEPRPQHGAPDRPAADPTYTPTDNLPTRTHTATPTDATTARPSDAGQPHTHGPTGGLTPQALATSGTEDLRPQRTAGRCPSSTTPHQPDHRHDRQNRHLPAARPPAQAPARIRHAPPPRRTPRSLPTRGPTRAATRGGRPRPGGTAAGGRWRRTAYTANPTAARRARGGRGRTAETPATNADTSTNRGTWRGNGPNISAECRPDERQGTRRRRGIGRWQA